MGWTGCSGWMGWPPKVVITIYHRVIQLYRRIMGYPVKVSEFRIFCKSVRISSYYKIKVISRDKQIGGGVFLYSLRTNSIIFRGEIFILCLVFFNNIRTLCLNFRIWSKLAENVIRALWNGNINNSTYFTRVERSNIKWGMMKDSKIAIHHRVIQL